MQQPRTAAGKSPGNDAQLRRRPQQTRSRQKVEAILEAATALIGERGIDAVSMRDIARATDMPLSAIYQYFPNKSAIVEQLFVAFTNETRSKTAAVAATVSGPADFLDATERLLVGYYETVRNHPAIADVINAVLADKKLAHLDVEDSRWHAMTLCDSIEGAVAPSRRDEFRRLVFMLNHLIGGLMRLLLSVDDEEARRMLNDYRLLARRRLEEVMK
jgi:AcrR family transcriptional regulator